MLNSNGTVRPRGTQKGLIINADDFGLSTEIDRGIIQCRQHGVLTSSQASGFSDVAAIFRPNWRII